MRRISIYEVILTKGKNEFTILGIPFIASYTTRKVGSFYYRDWIAKPKGRPQVKWVKELVNFLKQRNPQTKTELNKLINYAMRHIKIK